MSASQWYCFWWSLDGSSGFDRSRHDAMGTRVWKCASRGEGPVYAALTQLLFHEQFLKCCLWCDVLHAGL